MILFLITLSIPVVAVLAFNSAILITGGLPSTSLLKKKIILDSDKCKEVH